MQRAIDFPVLGNIKVVGLSTIEIADKIEKDSKYIKDPNVRTRLVNYKISVLGEVQSQEPTLFRRTS